MNIIQKLRARRAARAANAAGTYTQLLDRVAGLNGNPTIPDELADQVEKALADQGFDDATFEQHLQLKQAVMAAEAEVAGLDVAKAQRVAAKAESELAELREEQRRQRETWRELEASIQARLEPAQGIIKRHEKAQRRLRLARADLGRGLDPARFTELEADRQAGARAAGDASVVRQKLRSLDFDFEDIHSGVLRPGEKTYDVRKPIYDSDRQALEGELEALGNAEREAERRLVAAGLMDAQEMAQRDELKAKADEAFEKAREVRRRLMGITGKHDHGKRAPLVAEIEQLERTEREARRQLENLAQRQLENMGTRA